MRVCMLGFFLSLFPFFLCMNSALSVQGEQLCFKCMILGEGHARGQENRIMPRESL